MTLASEVHSISVPILTCASPSEKLVFQPCEQFLVAP